MKNEILNRWSFEGPTFEELNSLALYSFKNEHELLKSIEQVQFFLTQDRTQIEYLYQDIKLVSAYFLFYFPTHITKFYHYWQKINISYQDILSSLAWVDFGAGPGTYSWPLLQFAKKVHMIERAPLMREQADVVGKFLFKDIGELPYRIGGSFSGFSCEENTGIFFGHSFNEFSGDTGNISEFLKMHDWKAIILLEPGTKETFQKILQLRDVLLSNSYSIIYPCPSNAPCPMEGIDDWCHQFLRLKFPADVERMSQKLKINRRDVANIFHVYVKNDLDMRTKRPPRIVGGVWEEKGKFEWLECYAAAEQNQINLKQLLKRKLSKDELERVGHLYPGDQLDFEQKK